MFIGMVIGLTALAVVLAVTLLLLKVVFSVVLFPFRLGWFMAKALLALVIGLPMLLVGAVLLAVSVPLVLVLVVLPLCLLGALVLAVVR